jgi:putative peptide zinc metalloprotease protein
VLTDGTHVPVVDALTIGRAAGNTIQLSEPTVSRHHARILVEKGMPTIEDVGSSYGTAVDRQQLVGRVPLRDGSSIRIGDVELRVEARRSEAASGRTIVVPIGASVVVSTLGRAEVASPTESFGLRPRVHTGWALKRLEAGEGDRRFVLKNLRDGSFVRMSADDAALFELLDGQRSLHELIAEANQRFGADGATRLASLLADLGERGLLEGVEERQAAAPVGLVRRLLGPRTYTVGWAGDVFERLYRSGGFLFFTPLGLLLIAATALGGGVAFVTLIASGEVTPFVVGQKLGLGSAVFLVGRFLVVLLHEIAHGLVVASFGRRVPRAGLKLVLVFPYAFVDTSDGWFEPSRRRLAISAAGPMSDLTVGGAAALAALAVGSGTLRDVFFQLALGAYIGAFFNLNPLLERDGYHMLVDVLHEPGLRRRSQQWLVGSLGGRKSAGDASVHGVYAGAALAWSLLSAAFAITMSRRYYPHLVALAPRAVVWVVLGALYLLVLIPVIAVVYPALLSRLRDRRVQPDAA